MIIDSHAHVFPDRMCRATIEKLAVANPEHTLPYYNDGSVTGAKAKMAEWGIDLGIILPIATNARQQGNVNAFALAVQETEEAFITLGTVYPDAPDCLSVLDAVVAGGAHGLKLHPDYQGFFIDEEKMHPIYARCQALGVPILFHTGYDPISPGCIHATPEGIIRVAKQFPELTMVAAHTGGLAFGEVPLDCYKGIDNLYFDTAIASITFTPEAYRRIIDCYGPHRFLFGTDNPWGDGAKDLAFFNQVSLSAEEGALIFERNARSIFHI